MIGRKNFAIIVQTSNPFVLIGRGNLGNDIIEFYDRAFGHAVIVLKVDGELYYKGYRFNIQGEDKLRELRYKLYINAHIQPLQNEKMRKEIENILRRGGSERKYGTRATITIHAINAEYPEL